MSTQNKVYLHKSQEHGPKVKQPNLGMIFGINHIGMFWCHLNGEHLRTSKLDFIQNILIILVF